MAEKARGYKSIGSFFSDNVDDMMALPDDQYRAPDPLIDDADLLAPVSLCAEQAGLGIPARSLFLIDFSEWTFLNHGAFGAPSRAAFDAAARWRLRCESQPLRHIDRELFAHSAAVTRALARRLNASPRDVVLCQNATSALCAVILNFPLQKGDAVFALSIGYGSVKLMLQEAARRASAEFVEGAVRFPLTLPDGAGAPRKPEGNGGADGDDSEAAEAEEAIVRLVAASLPPNARLAVFDSVTSNTALRLPLARLVVLCRARGCAVLVDGAHALGALPVDLEALGADFFVANCHKHFCGARGAAVLHAQRGRQAAVRPAVLSHGAEAGFASRFVWDGNRDYSPALALGTAMRFWDALGGAAAAQAHMRATLAAGCAALLRRWRTRLLAPLGVCSNMALVMIPCEGPPGAPGALRGGAWAEGEADGPCAPADSKDWQDWLHDEARIEVPVKTVQGRMYVRVTAHLYNAVEDFERLAAAVGDKLGIPGRPEGGED